MSPLERWRNVSSRLLQGNAAWLWYSLAAIAIGVDMARWVWLIAAPPAVAVLPASRMDGPGNVEALFGVVSAASDGAAGLVVLPGVRLLGVFAPLGAGTGFAILQLDEKRQAGVALGDAVPASSGVRLAEIYADHVVLERAGMKQQVKLEGLKLDANPAASAVANVPLPVQPAALSAPVENMVPSGPPIPLQRAEPESLSGAQGAAQPAGGP